MPEPWKQGRVEASAQLAGSTVHGKIHLECAIGPEPGVIRGGNSTLSKSFVVQLNPFSLIGLETRMGRLIG